MRKLDFDVGAILFGVALTIGGWGLVYTAIGNPLDELALIRRGETILGVIVDSGEEREGDRTSQTVWYYRVVYKYRLPDGREFIQPTEGEGRLKDEFRDISQPYPVQVEYLPDNPAVSRIKGDGCQSVFEWLWRKVALGALLLAVLFIPGVFILCCGLGDLICMGRITSLLSRVSQMYYPARISAWGRRICGHTYYRSEDKLPWWIQVYGWVVGAGMILVLALYFIIVGTHWVISLF